jgi:putative ABC transport system permease protein
MNTRTEKTNQSEQPGSGHGLIRLWEDFLQDLNYVVRGMRRKPGLLLASVAILALGTSATTTMFSIIDAVLLRPLPYPHAEQIVLVSPSYNGDNVNNANVPKFEFWRQHSKSFSALAAYRAIGSGLNLAGNGEPENVAGLRVSMDFFNVLQMPPAHGRGFSADEDTPTGPQAVILSDALWRRRFTSDPGLIGKTITLNDVSYLVVGIMPPTFQFVFPADVMVPLRPNPVADKGNNYWAIGRLAPGVTRAQAASEMKIIGESMRSESPEAMSKGETVAVTDYQETVTLKSRSILLILVGAAVLIQLIACANVAGLQLARATSRQKEIGIRAALGATRQRIVRQLLAEAGVISLLGGALGFLIAAKSVPLLLNLIPEGIIPRIREIGLDVRVLAFALISSVVVTVLSGLLPSFRLARTDVNLILKEDSGSFSWGVSRTRWHNLLTVAEIALSLVLLVTAVLLLRTFSNLRTLDLGFDSHNVLTFQTTLIGKRYSTSDQALAFYQRALEQIKSLPGVESAAVTNTLPMAGVFNLPMEITGRGEMMSVESRIVTPEYFRVFGVAMHSGRQFSDTDRKGAAGVVIVNDAFARRYLGDTNPLSQSLIVARVIGDTTVRQVVGVVSDTKQLTVRGPAPPMVFLPLEQVPEKIISATITVAPTRFAIRAKGDPLNLAPQIKQTLLSIDSSLPLTNVLTMDQIVSRSIAPEQFNGSLLGIFAAIGLVLAVTGIFATVSYFANQRIREIGIRIALGSRPTDIFKLVLKRGLALAVEGVVVGGLASYGATRLIQHLLFGVTPTDPLTFVLVSLLVIVAALLACYLPALRATKVDPIIVLK